MNVMNANTEVRVRIDSDTKDRASMALAAMGLSVSDAIRILLLRVAAEKRMPFEVKTPNATTIEAIEELDRGGGKEFDDLDKLFDDLGISEC